MYFALTWLIFAGLVTYSKLNFKIKFYDIRVMIEGGIKFVKIKVRSLQIRSHTYMVIY